MWFWLTQHRNALWKGVDEFGALILIYIFIYHFKMCLCNAQQPNRNEIKFHKQYGSAWERDNRLIYGFLIAWFCIWVNKSCGIAYMWRCICVYILYYLYYIGYIKYSVSIFSILIKTGYSLRKRIPFNFVTDNTLAEIRPWSHWLVCDVRFWIDEDDFKKI